MKTDDFYLKHDEPNASCLIALRQLVLEFDEEIKETVKYGMPGFSYKGKMFCYLWTDKKTTHPYLLIVEGNRLEHYRLTQGNRSRMKIFPINPNEDIPLEEVYEVLNLALDLYKTGVIKTK